MTAIANVPELGFFLLVILGTSVFGFERFLRLQARRRMIQDMPTARIRSTAQGYVEFEGRAQASSSSPILSPLTHTPCVWYRFKVEEWGADSENRNSWATIDSNTSTHLFLLDDNTGECIIDPDKAIVEPAHKEFWEKDNFRYFEELIFPGEQLYTLGWFKSYDPMQDITHDWVRDTLIDWNSDPIIRRRFAKIDNRNFVAKLFAEKNDYGKLDAEDFATLKVAAKEFAQSAQIEFQQAMRERSREGQTHMLNADDPQRRPMIISIHPQEKRAECLRIYAWLWLAGALGALGLLIFILTEVYRWSLK